MPAQRGCRTCRQLVRRFLVTELPQQFQVFHIQAERAGLEPVVLVQQHELGARESAHLSQHRLAEGELGFGERCHHALQAFLLGLPRPLAAKIGTDAAGQHNGQRHDRQRGQKQLNLDGPAHGRTLSDSPRSIPRFATFGIGAQSPVGIGRAIICPFALPSYTPQSGVSPSTVSSTARLDRDFPADAAAKESATSAASNDVATGGDVWSLTAADFGNAAD